MRFWRAAGTLPEMWLPCGEPDSPTLTPHPPWCPGQSDLLLLPPSGSVP